MPAASVAVAVTVPVSVRCPSEVTDQLPEPSAVTVEVLPSSQVTVTVAFGSAVPNARIVLPSSPLTFSVGAAGACMSADTVAGGLLLPDGSVAVAVTVPEPCGVGDSTDQLPDASAVVVEVEPFGHVTVSVEPGSAVPDALMRPSWSASSMASVGAAGACMSADTVAGGLLLPDGSVAVAVTVPEPCGVGDSTDQLPDASAVVVEVEPFGHVTVSVEPGSALPDALMRPSWSASLMASVGAAGACMSADTVAGGLLLPDGSVAVAVTVPEPCGVGDSTDQLPDASAVVVEVEPFGHVTVSVEPGSALPDALMRPSWSASLMASVGAAGACMSADTVAGGLLLPDGSVAVAVTVPEPCGVGNSTDQLPDASAVVVEVEPFGHVTVSVEPGSALPDALMRPSWSASLMASVGAAGACMSADTVAGGLLLPDGSVAVAVTVPEPCGVGDSTDQLPDASAVVVEVEPFGHVTVSVEPGSALPDALMRPSWSASLMASVGAAGACMSADTVAGGLLLPDGSVAVAVTVPEPCGVGDSTDQLPDASAVVVEVEPFGHVTVSVEPGSALPDALMRPSWSGSETVNFGVPGAFVSPRCSLPPSSPPPAPASATPPRATAPRRPSRTPLPPSDTKVYETRLSSTPSAP